MAIVSDLYPYIQDLLMGRVIPTPKMADAIRKTTLEMTENYDAWPLQITQPPQQFTAFVSAYSPSFFFPDPTIAPSLNPAVINRFKSFFLFNDAFIAPGSSGYTGTNSGYELTYRTINNLTVLLNQASMPIHWTRYNGLIWIAPIPDQSYWFQLRFQNEHLFPLAGTPTEGSDPLLIPNTWMDVIEYGAAQRLAQIYNLSTKATELNERLNGDAKFQRTEGIEGQPGLIFQRTSQEQRDQRTTVKQFRLRMGVSR